MAKIENFFFYLNLTSVIWKTNSKFEKNTFCYGVKQLFLFDLSPNTTI